MSVYDIADVARLVWSRSWRWLVWSPRRLGLVVAGVLVIVIGWTQITGAGPGLPSDDTDGVYTSDDLPPGWQEWQVVTAEPESEVEPVTASPPTSVAPTTTEPEAAKSDREKEETGTGSPAHKPPSKQTRRAAKAAAVSFAQAYLHTERPRDKWYATLAPRAVEPLRKPLKTVDPKNITATRFTGVAKIDSLSEMGGRVVVPTNAGKLVLGVTNTGSRWAVSKVIPPVRSSSPR